MHERGRCTRCRKPLFWVEGRGLGVMLIDPQGSYEVFEPMCMVGMELDFQEPTWGEHQMDLPASEDRLEIERWLSV